MNKSNYEKYTKKELINVAQNRSKTIELKDHHMMSLRNDTNIAKGHC